MAVAGLGENFHGARDRMVPLQTVDNRAYLSTVCGVCL
ncbi:unnamed protein product [Ascophyllum nodosum]